MPVASSQPARCEIRSDLREAHARAWHHIASPGTWWTSAERLAIAAETRAARDCAYCVERKAALSPTAVSGTHDSTGQLPANLVDVIHRIVTDPGRLSQSWLRGVLEDGLQDTHYVELVAVVVFTHALDIFRRALGLEVAPLPAPIRGEATRVRPALAHDDGAWVPLIPSGEEGGAFALELYQGLESVPNIGRALSLVPAEVVRLHEFSGSHYMQLRNVRNPHYETPGRAIDRLQMELVAARVSRMNECFY